MLEMYITVRWITNQDQNKRAEDFAFFVAKRKEYAAQIFAKYRPGSAVATDAVKFVERMYKDYADRYDSFKFWSNKPNNLRALAEEKEVLIPGLVPPNDDGIMLYELPYSMASDYVHVTAVALDGVFPRTGVPYSASGGKEPRRVLDAVFEATQWLFYIAVRVVNWDCRTELMQPIKSSRSSLTSYDSETYICLSIPLTSHPSVVSVTA
jgi:hypothetical protein